MVTTVSNTTALARPLHTSEVFWPEAEPADELTSVEVIQPPGDMKELIERDLVELIADLAEVAQGDGKVLDELAVRFRDFDDRLQGIDRRLRRIEKLAAEAGH